MNRAKLRKLHTSQRSYATSASKRKSLSLTHPRYRFHFYKNNALSIGQHGNSAPGVGPKCQGNCGGLYRFLRIRRHGRHLGDVKLHQHTGGCTGSCCSVSPHEGHSVAHTSHMCHDGAVDNLMFGHILQEEFIDSVGQSVLAGFLKIMRLISSLSFPQPVSTPYLSKLNRDLET